MGAGIVGLCGGSEREWSIPLGVGTNQRAELGAVIAALELLQERAGSYVDVYTDSRYVVGLLQEFHSAKANEDLVARAKALVAECGFCRFHHVPGHSGVTLNERAHRLAEAARDLGEPEVEEAEGALAARCRELEVQVGHLASALQFYADPLCYAPREPPAGGSPLAPTIAVDRGHCARATLLVLGFEAAPDPLGSEPEPAGGG